LFLLICIRFKQANGLVIQATPVKDKPLSKAFVSDWLRHFPISPVCLFVWLAGSFVHPGQASSKQTHDLALISATAFKD